MPGVTSWKYLTSQIAAGKENYHAARGEAPGDPHLHTHAVMANVTLWCERAKQEAQSASEAIRRADSWLEKNAVELLQPGKPPAWGQEGGGCVVLSEKRHFSTPLLLAHERECMRDLAALHPDQTRQTRPGTDREDAGLSAEQKQPVSYLTRRDSRVRILHRPGGTGKTYITQVARAEWTALAKYGAFSAILAAIMTSRADDLINWAQQLGQQIR